MLIQWIHMQIHNNMQNFSRYIHYIGYYGVNAKSLLKILQDEIYKHKLSYLLNFFFLLLYWTF